MRHVFPALVLFVCVGCSGSDTDSDSYARTEQQTALSADSIKWHMFGDSLINTSNLTMKEWHVSPSRDPRSSAVYPYVEWHTIENIEYGMSREELECLIWNVQNYHHRINTIVYSTAPSGVLYEVAIKLSSTGIVEDVSFKDESQP